MEDEESAVGVLTKVGRPGASTTGAEPRRRRVGSGMDTWRLRRPSMEGAPCRVAAADRALAAASKMSSEDRHALSASEGWLLTGTPTAGAWGVWRQGGEEGKGVDEAQGDK